MVLRAGSPFGESTVKMPRRRRARPRHRVMMVSEIAIGYKPNATTLVIKRQNLYDKFVDRPFRIDHLIFKAGMVNGNSAMDVVRVYHPGFGSSATTSGSIIITMLDARRRLKVRSPEWWPADQSNDTTLVAINNCCRITGGDKCTIRVSIKLFIQLGEQEVIESCPKQLHAIPIAMTRLSLGESYLTSPSTPLHIPPLPLAGPQYKADDEPASGSWISLLEEDGRPAMATGSAALQPVTMELESSLENTFQGGMMLWNLLRES